MKQTGKNGGNRFKATVVGARNHEAGWTFEENQPMRSIMYTGKPAPPRTTPTSPSAY
jgi:hypothetical protein